MESQDSAPQARQGAYRALMLLFVINLLNYIDRYILAAVEPILRKDFGLDRSQTGLLSTAFLITYMIAAPFLGALADRFSRWLIIGLSIAVWSLASGWTGLAGSFGILLLSRIFVGIGEAGYGPAAPSLIADLFPEEKRGRMMSFFYIALPAGSALGYAFGGYMSGEYGWRSAFYAVVIPGLILAVICLFMKESRPVAKGGAAAPRATLKDYLAILRIPSYFYNTAAMAAMTFAIGAISFWLPGYILEYRSAEFAQSADLSAEKLLAQISTTFGLIVVVSGLLSSILGGWMGDRLRARYGGAYFLVSGFGILLSFPAMIAIFYIPFPYAWIAVFVTVFFLFFNTGPSNTALANVTSSGVRATAFAMNIFLIHALGDAISPPLIGWIGDKTSMEFALKSVSVVMLVASAFWLVGARYLAADTAKAGATDPLRGT